MERVGFGAYQEYVIAEGFDPNVNDEKSFITHIKSLNIEGVTVLRQRGRTYYNDGYASHILGTLGKITAENALSYRILSCEDSKRARVVFIGFSFLL